MLQFSDVKLFTTVFIGEIIGCDGTLVRLSKDFLDFSDVKQ